MTQQVALFRELHSQKTPLILPNVWDAGGARLVESLGAKAVATTSAGVSWSMGYADGYALPIDLQIELTERMARVITIPLSIDIENGYSDDPAVVAGNILRITRAGASGINLEDGHDDPSAVVEKIKAIRLALKKAKLDLFINLRTDVYLHRLVPAEMAIAETIRRGTLYKKAGADGLFVPALTSAKEIKTLVGALPMPINVLAWGGLPTAAELAALGVKRLSAGSHIPQVLAHNMAELTKDFLATGDSSAFLKGSIAHGDLQKLFVHINKPNADS